MSTTTEEIAPTSAEPTLGTAIARLSSRMTDRNRADPGELAQLRRLASGNLSPAFWRVLTREVPEPFRTGKAREDIWAGLLAAFALLAPLGTGRGEPVGHALAETGYNEPRLIRMLRADRGRIRDELVTAARWLMAHGRATDWLELTHFAFSRIKPESGSDHWTARRIARDYFTAVSRTEDARS